MPRAIIFDWDNTLVDTWEIIHDTLNATFDEYGLAPWTLAQTRARVRNSLRDSFPALFGDKWEEAGKTFYRIFDETHIDRLKPLPGAMEMLADLTDAGIYLGVVSNKNGIYLRREAGHLGWDHFFGAIIGATDALQDKPAPDPVVMALGNSFSTGADIWMAGDSAIDLECAYNAGCTPILVRPQLPKPGEFDTHPPVHHFENCQELSNWIKSMVC